MKAAIISIAILWTGGVCHAVTLSDIVGQVSVNSYSNWLDSLFTSDGNSRGFTDGDSFCEPLPQHDLARDFMVANFHAMGYDTWLDPFTFTFQGALYTNCNNVVAIKHGYGGTNIYVVGAHYDSVDSAHTSVTRCPGADDNGSAMKRLKLWS